MHERPRSPRPATLVGLGFHKTGTKALAACLGTLGCLHRSLDREAFAL